MTANSEKNNVTIADEETSILSINNVDQLYGQVNFKANFSCLSLKMLKFLYQEMGISDISIKQKLISRLVSKYKGREESSNDLFEKEKVMNIVNVVGNTENSLPRFSDKKKVLNSENDEIAGMLIDKVLSMSKLNYLLLAKQVALKKVYIVKVVDKDGWKVVTKMALNNLVDPIS
ncbi:15545_t:CDS:2 [Cetraspora pellucida]|uniref:15545_t:CDS:1 n=1 Tax=Cetraspora pellucida TaxID=1433469 RepID=A0A9N8VX55_9GLOM|nr:15545_t:CDS:2 [Cetraspora pellucida]